MKSNKSLILIAIVLIAVSVSLALYPALSKYYFNNTYDNKIAEFDLMIQNVQEGNYDENHNNGNVDENGYVIDNNNNKVNDFAVLYKEDLERLHKDSSEYNNKLSMQQSFKNGFESSALDLTSYGIFNGIYGYVSAPTINLNIPIYLGANDYNMRYGATHLYNTSLPIGGKSTNTVLSGHTGYIGRTLFDNIPNLSQGDIVTITNYFGTLNYRVTEEKNVESTDIEDAYIQKDKDILVLLTCSNGGATRYIVICERIY